jgi:P4 family phage/plasmid primase-like protien
MIEQFKEMIKFGGKLKITNGKKDFSPRPKDWQNMIVSKYNNQKDFCILTGAINDILVIDLDRTKEEKEKDIKDFTSLKWFTSIFGEITDVKTLITSTVNGGFHIYFKYTDNIKHKEQVHPKVDIISDKGCVYEGSFYKIFNDYQIISLTDNQIKQLKKDQEKKVVEKVVEKVKQLPKITETSLDEIKNEITIFVINNYSNKFEETCIKIEKNSIIVSLQDKYCNFIEMEHNSNNQYIVINELLTSQRCHDTLCQGKRHKVINTPDIIANFFKENVEINLKSECELLIKKSIGSGEITDLVKSDIGYSSELINYSEILNSNHNEVCFKCKSFIPSFVINNELKGVCVKCNNCLYQYPKQVIEVCQNLYPTLYYVINVTNNYYTSKDKRILSFSNREKLEITDNKIINDNLYLGLEGREKPLSKIMFQEKKDVIKYSNKNWYKYDTTVWKLIDKCIISDECNTELLVFYEKFINAYRNNNKILNEDRMDLLELNIRKMNIKLESEKWHNGFENLSKPIFIDMEFEEKLNKNTDILCFNNCVYELETGITRSGNPKDLSTLKINFDFPEKSNEIIRKELMDIIKSIIPDQETLHYTLKHISSGLSGRIREHLLHIWTANGSNGKSTLINLCESTLGDYCCSLKSSVLTDNGNTNPDSATTSLNSVENKRFITMQETKKGAKLNEAFVKLFTSNDTLKIRHLHQEERAVIPQHKIILCTNDKPEIIGQDNGIWRRIRVVNFGVTFVNKDDWDKIENKSGYGLIDFNLEATLKKDCYKTEFILILLEYYKLYIAEGLKPSKKIEEDSKEYRLQSDIVIEYITEKCKFEKGNKNLRCKAVDLYNDFELYKRDEKINQTIKRGEFYKRIDKMTGYEKEKKIHINNSMQRGWYGIHMENAEINAAEILDN